MTLDEAKQRFNNFGCTFTLDEARQDVHILLEKIYTDFEVEKQATKSCTNCQSYNAHGEYSKCKLHISTALGCLYNNFSVWRKR